jgi:flagellar biosynthetic protein FliO
MILAARQTAPGPENLEWVSSELMMLVQLAFVLAAILALAYVVLRVIVPRVLGVNPAGAGPIAVVARYPLEPRRNLYIVQVGTELFLIGTSENSIQFLTSLDAEKLGPQLETAAPRPRTGGEFGRFLDGLRNKSPKA